MIPITLSTIHNIRDLGGTKTADGRVIRPGCLIRSAHLGGASAEDVESLRREHRLHTVIDLRTVKEREEQPDFTEGLDYQPLPVIEDLRAGITHEKKAEAELFPDMAYLYREMMNRAGSRAGFRRVLTAIFTHDYDQGSVLWHCTEGKDRTGFMCMLIEALAGAGYREIVDDYMITYDNYYEITEKSDKAKYDTILDRNLIAMIRYLVNDDSVDITTADLSVYARDFLLSIGMTDAEIDTLLDRLTD